MSNNETQEFEEHRSFEERVFARFDAIDLRMDDMDSKFEGRIGAVEIRITRLEQGKYEEKRIWEQVMAAILEVKADVAVIKTYVAEMTVALSAAKMNAARTTSTPQIKKFERKLDA